MKLAIVSGNYEQALVYAKENNLQRQDWFYISDPNTLMGMREGKYVEVGTYYEKPEYFRILEMLYINGFTKV